MNPYADALDRVAQTDRERQEAGWIKEWLKMGEIRCIPPDPVTGRRGEVRVWRRCPLEWMTAEDDRLLALPILLGRDPFDAWPVLEETPAPPESEWPDMED